jgi:signal transduction histidine kinase
MTDEGAPTEEAGLALKRLVGAVQDLSLARDLSQIMEIVRRAARELTGADGASFVLREGDQCHYADDDAIGPLWKGRRFPMAVCISGWAMLYGESVSIEDIYDDARIPADAYRPTFVRSLSMVPIRTKAPIGAIGTYWARRHRTTERELALLQALADSTSVAMENVEVHAELEQRVRDRTRELAERNDALLELQRHREELSTLVVHDLKSPASAIMLAASMQMGDATARRTDQRRWQTVYSSAEHILRTAVSLLDIAELEEARLSPRHDEVDLRALLEETRDLLLPLCEGRRQSIDVCCDVPAGVPVADRELVWRVLQNLVDNALRHCPDGSTVHVSARADGDSVIVVVCDEGPGIPHDMRARVFERHVRLGGPNEARTGWGLGLCFCKLAVEAQGGSIWIEDNVPRGSRFCFRLPLRS